MVRDGEVYGPSSVDELLQHRKSFESLRRSGLMSTLTLRDGSAGVRPDEVILATHPIDGLSAQNCIEGTLCRMVDHGDTILCFIDTAAGRLMADITPASVQQLSLVKGSPVWCLFKTYALHRTDSHTS